MKVENSLIDKAKNLYKEAMKEKKKDM